MKLANKYLNILIIDDSVFFSQALKIKLEQTLNINSIEIYNNSLIAYYRLQEILPDLIILDIEMPNLNGIDFLKKIGKDFPTPVIVVSSSASNSLKALEEGALEFVVKPDPKSSSSFNQFVDMLSQIIGEININKITVPNKNKQLTTIYNNNDIFTKNNNKFIAIGASTGGVEAILYILKALPANTNGIVIAIHMPENFTNIYAERLNTVCKLKVKEAKDLDKIEKGIVLIAKGGHHLTVHKGFDGHFVKIVKTSRFNGHMPSVDKMFYSIAKLKNSECMGIILTGMGNDGAYGLLDMKKAGFYTVGQSEKDCTVYGMPLVAKQINAIEKQVYIGDMPNSIINYINKNDK